MKNCSIFILLVLVALFTCGFDWGFGGKDKCGDAKRLVTELALVKTAAERTAMEGRILHLCPEGAAGHFIKAINLEKAGNIDGASTEYGEALKDAPMFPQASGNLGLIHLQQGLYDEAAVELTVALKTVSDPRYHRGLARIFNERKLYTLAVYHYNEVALTSPGDAVLHAALAETYGKMGRLDSAEEEYGKALKIEPVNESARLGLAAVLVRKNLIDRAIVELTTVQKSDPQNKEIHRLLAGAYEKKADWKAAEVEYLLAGLAGGEKPSLYVGRVRKGDAYLKAKEYDKAIEEYRGAVKEKPESTEALQKLGDALMGGGHDDDAITVYREALRLKADNGAVNYNLGQLYEKKGLLDEAVVEYRQSLKLLPENGEARRRLAEIYLPER